MYLSQRAQDSLKVECPLSSLFMKTIHKFHHPLFNPTGAINLGVAHNDLLTPMIFEKFQSCLEIIPYDINYGSPAGSPALREVLVSFFTKYFKPYEPLHADDILVQTGAGASLNQLFQAIGDQDDYCMVPAPYYGAFDVDVSVNTGIKIIKVYPHNLQDITVDGDELERVYQHAQSEGKRITSILLANPENPLGRCYTKRDLETFLIFASKHQLHIVLDEIYALSSFSHVLDKTKEDPFISILSLNYKELINPCLVHVIYGLSKDFGVNGFRVGFIIDQFNKPLKSALHRSSPFTYISSITDRLLYNVFSDEKWVDEYLQKNRCVLAESYQRTIEYFSKHDIDFIPAEAGLFITIDLRPAFRRTHGKEMTIEDAEATWNTIWEHGVYITPGNAFYFEEPGLYRVTFSLPWEIIQKGLDIIVSSIV